MSEKLKEFLSEPEIDVLPDDAVLCVSVENISDFTLTLGDLRVLAPTTRPVHDDAIVVSELNVKIKADGDGFLICGGQHHVDESCEFERFSRTTAMTAAPATDELVAEVARLTKRLADLAVGFDVPDGGRYIADWQVRIAKYKAALSSAPVAEAVTEEIVTAAMRAFEPYAGRLLRYPEAERWHMNDVQGMREALRTAFALARHERGTP